MTTRRSSRRSFRPRAPRRVTTWFNTQSVPAAVAPAGQAIVDLLSTESPAALEPKLTVIRAIVEVGIHGSSSGTSWYGAFGMSVITRDALAAGAVPDPISDFVDWYWHKNYYGRSTVGGGPQIERFPIDLRTARAIRGVGRTLAFILDVNAASGSGVNFSVSARLLLAH